MLWATRLLKTALYGAGTYGVLHFTGTHVGYLTVTSGASMEPTISKAGEVLFVNTRFVSDQTRPFQRGQIVTSLSPIEPNKCVIKRILALEGDMIEFSVPGLNEAQLFVVPKNKVWLVGDNPGESVDSRNYGPVPIALLQGQVTHRIYPKFESLEADELSFLDTHYDAELLTRVTPSSSKSASARSSPPSSS